jgi:hypothetical protein
VIARPGGARRFFHLCRRRTAAKRLSPRAARGRLNCTATGYQAGALRPSRPAAWGRKASITNPRWSSSGTPSSSAPAATSARSTVAAKLVLEALLHRCRLQAGDAVGADQAARHHEAGRLVAREQGPVESAVVGHAPAGVVGRHRVGDRVLAAITQPREDPARVLVEPRLVVGVVQYAGDAPGPRYRRRARVARRRGAHHQLDRARVAA